MPWPPGWPGTPARPSGPWTQLLDETIRLQILSRQDRAGEVLSEVTRLRQHLDSLPDHSGQPETARAYNVRETLLGTGHTAALRLERWDDALTLSAEIQASEQRRGASEFEKARTRFNDYGPLLRLGRLDQARALLRDCRDLFEREHATADLGKTLSALADIEDKAGHGQDAIDLERTALRYKYLTPGLDAIAGSHHNLGNYLARHAADHPRALTHHLTAALLHSLAGDGLARAPLTAAAEDLTRLPAGAAVPAAPGKLSAAVGEVPGVHLDKLLAQLTPDPAATASALTALLGQARATTSPATPHARHLAAWDPVIAGITAARYGDDHARAAATRHLTSHLDSPDWHDLATTLSGLLADGPDTTIPDGLDAIDSAITRRAFAALHGDLRLPPGLWRAIPLTALIGRVIGAAVGDQAAAGQVSQALTDMDDDSDLASLATALRAILNGDRAPGLADGLDPASAAAITTILAHLPQPDPEPQPASQPADPEQTSTKP